VIASRSVSSAPAGYRFPREVIAVAVRWHLRYGLSYRDVEELLAERGIEVDHVTVYRWVEAFTAEFVDAALPARHATRDRWFVDETYVKVAGPAWAACVAWPRQKCPPQAAQVDLAFTLQAPASHRP
jgi:transposase-like protein